MKRYAIVCALILALSLLSGCFPAVGITVTSLKDEEFQREFQESWDESMDEIKEDWEDAWDEARDSWSQLEASDEKDHYWKILDSEETELGTVTEEEQVKALDDLLSDDGRFGSRMVEDPGEPAYSYIFCQEKTLLAGQDPDGERDYEELVRFTVSASEDVVTLRILESLPSLMGVDLGDFLTFTIDVPAETAEALRTPAQFLPS